MDISRQQFEQYIKLHTDPVELEQKLKKANNGLNYADRDVDLMWIGWQASRDALKPVGYVHEKELDFKVGIIDTLSCAFLYPCKDEYSDIPLYRLDK
ncbi:hypothetical protein RPN16_24850 [Salmonella enterica]|uniref:hypothetical protein n=1 Tax=Salmonella enterica TaxID=28901 RepID=UPI002B00218B|nr:hypothetical protein [Salmonella enterica]